MLKSLLIENVAVIDRLSVELGEGFTVLTGETGAGKSIMIDSLSFVLGGRVSRDLIRTGEEAALVCALFEDRAGETAIERRMALDGRGAARIDGRPATLAMLRSRGETLVNIHGQQDNQWLLQPERHIEFLDELADTDKLMPEYSACYDRSCRLKSKIESLKMDEREKSRRMDMLRFQVEEISEAKLKAGEQASLMERRAIMQNAERIARAVGAVCDALDPEDGEGAVSMAGEALRLLEQNSALAERMSGFAERLGECYYPMVDLAGELRDFFEELDFDGDDVDAVEARLDLIYRLTRKYGDTAEDVIAYCERAAAELNEIELADETTAALENELKGVYNELHTLADAISSRREKAAREGEKRVEEELKFLNMPRAQFVIQVRRGTDFGPTGQDEVEFLFSANAGEPPRQLVKIASGGELSRVMLALRAVLGGDGDAGTLVFDEIDAGVSGSAAEKIGLKLMQLSERRQVLCVTHLPQIACLAADHLVISKSEREGRTVTSVERVTGERRITELARLISGSVITSSAMEAARDMLARISKN